MGEVEAGLGMADKCVDRRVDGQEEVADLGQEVDVRRMTHQALDDGHHRCSSPLFQTGQVLVVTLLRITAGTNQSNEHLRHQSYYSLVPTTRIS